MLFNLKLVAFTCKQFLEKDQVLFAISLMSDIEKQHSLEFTLRVTEHFLVSRVGREDTAVGISKRDADSGVIEDRSPSQGLGFLSLRDLGRRRSVVGLRGWSRAAHTARGIDS